MTRVSSTVAAITTSHSMATRRLRTDRRLSGGDGGGVWGVASSWGVGGSAPISWLSDGSATEVDHNGDQHPVGAVPPGWYRARRRAAAVGPIVASPATTRAWVPPRNNNRSSHARWLER